MVYPKQIGVCPAVQNFSEKGGIGVLIKKHGKILLLSLIVGQPQYQSWVPIGTAVRPARTGISLKTRAPNQRIQLGRGQPALHRSPAVAHNCHLNDK